jgi:hypothetical protein
MLNSILSKLIVVNVKTGKPSYILTAFMVGVFIVNAKLLFSGAEFKGVKMSEFSGTDYAASIAALGGIYSLNKHMNRKDAESSNIPKETE